MYFKGNDFRNHQRRLWNECSFDPPMQSYLYLLLHLPRNPRISCRVLSNVQLWEGSVQCVQLCNLRIPTLPSVSFVQMSMFLPPCNNSMLRGENEGVAWRQEPVRMARSPQDWQVTLCHSQNIAKTVPQHCHWAGAVGSFASPLKLVIGPGGINCFLISWYFWLVQSYQRHGTTINQTPAVE